MSLSSPVSESAKCSKWSASRLIHGKNLTSWVENYCTGVSAVLAKLPQDLWLNDLEIDRWHRSRHLIVWICQFQSCSGSPCVSICYTVVANMRSSYICCWESSSLARRLSANIVVTCSTQLLGFTVTSTMQKCRSYANALACVQGASNRLRS